MVDIKDLKIHSLWQSRLTTPSQLFRLSEIVKSMLIYTYTVQHMFAVYPSGKCAI